MSVSTASRAIDKLEDKGLIEKEPIRNWTWKGRKDRTPKHNGVRYRITPIWDEVPVIEYGHDEAEEEVEQPAAVSAEAMAEVDRVLADDADFSPATRERGTKVTKEDADDVFKQIKFYFEGHRQGQRGSVFPDDQGNNCPHRLS